MTRHVRRRSWLMLFVSIAALCLSPAFSAQAFVSKKSTAKFAEHLKAYPKASDSEKSRHLRKMLRLYSWKQAAPNLSQMNQWMGYLKAGLFSPTMSLQKRSFYSFGEILEKLSFYRHKVKRQALQNLVINYFPWKHLGALCKHYGTRSGQEACFNLTWLKHRNDQQGLKIFAKMLQGQANIQQHALFFVGTQKLMPSPKNQEALAQLLLGFADKLTTERLITAMMVLRNMSTKHNWYKLTFYQRCLTNSYPRTRRVAADFIHKLGKDGRPATLMLAKLLNDKDDTVRREAIRALSYVQIPKPLLRLWLTPRLQDTYSSAQAQALYAFNKNKVPPLKSAVPVLIKMIHNTKFYSRYHAASLLPLYGQQAVSFLPQLLQSMKDNPKTSKPTTVLNVLEKAGKSEKFLPSLQWLLKQNKGIYFTKRVLAVAKKLGKKAKPLFPMVNKLLRSRSLTVAYNAAMVLQEMEAGDASTVKGILALFQKYPRYQQDMAETLFKVTPRRMLSNIAVYLLGSDYYAKLKGMQKLSFQIMVIGPMLDFFKMKVEHRQLYQALNPKMFPKLKPDMMKSNKKFASQCNKACRDEIFAIGKSATLLYENKMAGVLQTLLKTKAHPEVQKQAIDLFHTLLDHFYNHRRFHRNNLTLKAPKTLCLRLVQAALSKRKSVSKPSLKAFQDQCEKVKGKAGLKAALQRYSPKPKTPASAPASRPAPRR